MCGRYVSPDEAALERYWNLRRPGSPFVGVQGSADSAKINYNTVPTKMVPVERVGKDGPEIVAMRWGMDRKDWATGEVQVAKLNNARIEGVRTVKPFAAPFKSGQRGLQLVMGYYEWKEKAKPPKWKVRIPHYIRPTDQGETFALACVFDFGIESPDVLTCAVITMDATGRLADIDERMPAIVRLEDRDTWLNGTPEEAFACLRPYPDDLLEITRVRQEVGSSRASGAQLIEPDPNPEVELPTDDEIEAERLRESAAKARKEAERAEAKQRKEADKAAAKAEKERDREAERVRRAQERQDEKSKASKPDQGNLF